LDARSCITRTRVRFGETDAAGIVFYPTFFAWFDLGTHALLRAAMGTLHDDQGRPRWPLPIVESGANFLAPLFSDDEIAIRSTIAKIGSRSLRVEHEVTRGETVVARGFEARTLIARTGATIAAVALPDDLRAALSASVTTDGWA
jgi:acyl-CoA thioester hydrolase